MKRKSGAEGAAFRSFVVKESKHILRDKRTMLILFGMPVVMMLLFGFAISTDVRDVRTVVVTSSLDHQTQSLVQALDASEYFDILYTVGTPAEAERLMRNQKADMALVFSYDFASCHEGIQLMTDAADPNMAQQYAAYATQILASHVQTIQAPVPTGPNALAASTRAISPPLTKLLYNPQMKSAYNFVPGIMGMLLMLVCAMMTSISIVREKERGTMEVLLVSPIRPILIIVAKMVPYFVLGIIDLAFILVISHFVLAVPIAGSLMSLALVSMLFLIVALSLGLLLSVLTDTQVAAMLASGMMLLMPTIMLSGMIYPIESMPRILQIIADIVPASWFITACRKLMIMGVSITMVWKEIAAMTLMAVVLITFSLVKFKKRLE